jgi:hypothetical protein
MVGTSAYKRASHGAPKGVQVDFLAASGARFCSATVGTARLAAGVSLDVVIGAGSPADLAGDCPKVMLTACGRLTTRWVISDH